MLINELLNKDPDIVSKTGSLIILVSKFSVCMDKNVKDTKHKRHIATIVHFVKNGENLQNVQDWMV